MNTNNTFKQQQEKQFRYGKWTEQEEEYAVSLIEAFKEGLLEDVDEGESLRYYLSTKLYCNVKRVSKKYEGTNYQGARRFHKNTTVSQDELAEVTSKILELKQDFEASIKSSTKKKAALKKSLPRSSSSESATPLSGADSKPSDLSLSSGVPSLFPATQQATVASLEQAVGLHGYLGGQSLRRDPLLVQGLLGDRSVQELLDAELQRRQLAALQTTNLIGQARARSNANHAADMHSLLSSAVPASRRRYLGEGLVGQGQVLSSLGMSQEALTRATTGMPVAAAGAFGNSLGQASTSSVAHVAGTAAAIPLARASSSSVAKPSAAGAPARTYESAFVMPRREGIPLMMDEEAVVMATLTSSPSPATSMSVSLHGRTANNGFASVAVTQTPPQSPQEQASPSSSRRIHTLDSEDVNSSLLARQTKRARFC